MPLFRPKPSLFSSHIFRRPSRPSRYDSRCQSTQAQRIDRVLSRLPKFLHPYTSGLRNAPVSHVVAFLVLHEMTAVVPLIGLGALFHYTEWLPKGWSEAKYINDGVEKFGRYFRRKGWFGFSKEHDVEEIHIEEGVKEQAIDGVGNNGNGTRILVEVATAYAITKVLLPLRVVLSVWATPWFARIGVGRFGKIFRRLGQSGTSPVKSNAKRTSTTGSGISSTTGKP